jgi:hypothetical protein
MQLCKGVMCSNIDVLEPNLEADMLTQTCSGLPKPGTGMDHGWSTLAPSASLPQVLSRPGSTHGVGHGFIIENRV